MEVESSLVGSNRESGRGNSRIERIHKVQFGHHVEGGAVGRTEGISKGLTYTEGVKN